MPVNFNCSHKTILPWSTCIEDFIKCSCTGNLGAHSLCPSVFLFAKIIFLAINFEWTVIEFLYIIAFIYLSIDNLFISLQCLTFGSIIQGHKSPTNTSDAFFVFDELVAIH
jgi:hypothetical protein